MRLVKIIFSLLVVLTLIYLVKKQDKIVVNHNDLSKLREYDLILSKGQSMESKILNLLNYSIESYTHIGVIVRNEDEFYVLHSTPDGTEVNGIRFDKLQEFIDLSNVNSYKILRLNSLTNKLEGNIEYYKNQKIPFDFDFNNYDKVKIYCSELVFDIFDKTGLIKSKVDLDKPIHPKEFEAMSEFITVTERTSFANTSLY